MKVALCIATKCTSVKSDVFRAIESAEGLYDHCLLLEDGAPCGYLSNKVTERMLIQETDHPWNDYSNRLVLLARAAKYDCDWVFWLDDDEVVSKTMKEQFQYALIGAELAGATTVQVAIRTMWNETHYRCDGVFASQTKPSIQRNPFLIPEPQFLYTARDALHHFPLIAGPTYHLLYPIIHYGLCTEQLRVNNVQRYRRLDPENRHSEVPYEYLLDESAIQLRKL